MHFLKKGQKIRAWVDPPPLIRAMPERKRFFSVDVFPKVFLFINPDQQVDGGGVPRPAQVCQQQNHKSTHGKAFHITR